MFIIHGHQEMYLFLNMCNLCRYARFSQAQSQIMNCNFYWETLPWTSWSNHLSQLDANWTHELAWHVRYHDGSMYQFITLLITHNAKHNITYVPDKFLSFWWTLISYHCGFGTTTVTDSIFSVKTQKYIADSIMSSTSIACISQLTWP